MSSVDPNRLYSALLNTGLQSKNNPLYQVIYNLIGAINTINDEVNGIGSTSGGTGSTGAIGPQGIQGVIGPAGFDGENTDFDVMFPPGSLASVSAGPPGSHDLVGTADQVNLSASGVGSLAGANNITLSLPQSIATTSTPQFARIGIGTPASVGIPLTVLSITGTQAQFVYDGSNYTQVTVLSTGDTTWATFGTAPNLNLTPGGTAVTIVNSALGVGISPAVQLHVSKVQDAATTGIVSNTNNSVSSQAFWQSTSDVATISMRAHATLRVATRYGITLGGYSEILGGGNGLLMGVTTATPIVFGTNNLERMRILSTGEVGIGGTPTQKLEVFAGTTQLNNTAGATQLVLKDTTNTKSAFINANNDTLQFYGNGPTTERVRFDLANGRVGIGITPNFILDVQQTGSNPGINIDAVSGANFRSTIGFGVDSGVTVGWVAGQGFGSTTTRDFYILDVAANLTRIYIDTTGKVGIGTTSPAQLLDISNAAPSFQMTDTTASAKSLRLVVDANVANFYEAAGAAGDILSLDLTNKRVGIGTTGPAQMLDISSTAPSFQMTDTTASAKSLRLVVDANKANLYEAAGAAGDIMTWDLANKRVGIVQATPTAWLHLGIGASGASSAPLKFTSGTNLATPEVGTVEWDAVQLYHTIDTSSGRGAIPVEQYFHLTADGGTISTIANFFGTNSNINLVASAYYIIDIYCYFLCTTAGAVTWTLTNNNAPTAQNIYYEMSPVTGIVAPPGTATMLVGQFSKDTTAARTIVTASLTTAVDHYMHMRIELQNSAGGTTFKIQATKGTGGTITPRVNSYWICRRISPNNIGTFAG
jgi:hypothetical protein